MPARMPGFFKKLSPPLKLLDGFGESIILACKSLLSPFDL
jgi:hypothetical protein